MINRGGPAFVHRMTTTTTADTTQIAFAYAAVRDAYGLTELNTQIDKLDNQMEGATQLELYAEVKTLLVDQTLWFLRNVNFDDGLPKIIETYRDGVSQVRAVLGNILPTFIAQSIADQAVGFVNGGAPREISRRIAELSALTLASDIVLVAERSKASVADAAKAYFLVLETFKLGRITEQGGRIDLSDRFDRMALDRALANVMRAQRDLTKDVLNSGKGAIEARFATWREARAAETDRIVTMVTDLTEGELTVSRLSVAAGLLSDLVRA
jgi:glutamate dehydrogenase